MTDSRSSSRAMISVIERARGRSTAQRSMHLMSVALIVVFFVALTSSLAAGARMYRLAAAAQFTSNDLHLQSGLVTNIVRSNDVAGALRIDDGPEGPALVLSRKLESGTYETRLYHYQGQLMQEFTAAGQPYDPAAATALLATKTFSFTVNGRLITFTTDGGSFDVCLRSNIGSTQSAASASASDATLVTISDGGGTP